MCLDRELLGVYTQVHGSITSTSSGSPPATPMSEATRAVAARHRVLVQRLERVVLLLDAALGEARLAREAMLLYIQVCRSEGTRCLL